MADDLPPPPPPTIDDVFAEAAVVVCSFVSPRDLVSLGRANRQASSDVRNNLFHILESQRRRWPRDDGKEEADESVVISYKHSYEKREGVVCTLLEKVGAANLRYDPPGRTSPLDTLAETMSAVIERTDDESNWDGDEWYGTFANDPAEIWKPRVKHALGCRYGGGLERGRSRRCFIDYMLRRMKHQESTPRSQRLARDWARYVIAKEGVVGREWQWKGLDNEEAVGFMIHTPAGDELEIRIEKRAKKINPFDILRPRPSSALSGFGLRV